MMDERKQKIWDYTGVILAWLVMMGWVCLLCFIVSGCSPKVIYVPETHTEIVTKTDTFLKKDSVFCHDSVYVSSKGDTILVEKWHTKYRDRVEYKVKTDSFIKVDSVAVPYPVEKKLTKWQQIKLDLGGYTMIVSLGIVIFGILWLYLRRTGRRHN